MNRIVTYHFAFTDGSSWSYQLTFDETNRLLPLEAGVEKPWTKLGFHQCPHCPLKAETHPRCPVAANVDTIVEDSKATASTTRATVTVKTPEREYIKECSSQEGLLSLFGVIMASSNCPHLDWLRPLARFHLPFATIDETLFRALSLQLLTEFFDREHHDATKSAELLQKKYTAVETLNHAFINRIREYCRGDADKNALAGLDVFVQIFSFHREENFKAVQRYFV